MDRNNLQPGQSIQLTTNSIFYKNVYESNVLKVLDSSLMISTPYFKGLHVPLNIGFVLNLRIFTSDGVVSFNTEVIDRDLNEHSVTVRLPAHMKKDPEMAGAAASGCKFVTVTSGKGGVGKTSFIINYAISLAQLGKRVVLFDADLGMANVDVLLKANTRYSIIDVIEGTREIRDVISEAPGGIHIIAGGSGVQQLASLTTPQFYRITNGFDFLERNYDYVLIDTGAGLSKNVTDFIFASDEAIIITTPEPHAITDAYSIIKVILEKENKVHLKLIINKCETPQEGREVLHRICGVVRNFLNYSITPLCFIMENKAVSRSIREQVPLCLSYPNSEVARCILSLAESEAQGDKKQKEESAISSFVTRFKRIFGNG